MINKPTKIIVHHFGGSDAAPLSDSSNATAQDVDSWHKLRWPGFTSTQFKNDKGEFYHVGYHFVIEKNGKTVQCRGMDEEGAHVIGQNTSSIGVSLAGNFDLTVPTKAQERAFVKLYAKIIAAYPNINAQTIFPHRKYANKTCYGNNLKDDHFNLLVMTDESKADISASLMEQISMLKSKILALLTSKRYSANETNSKQ